VGERGEKGEGLLRTLSVIYGRRWFYLTSVPEKNALETCLLI
jgi:hypothetical protein